MARMPQRHLGWFIKLLLLVMLWPGMIDADSWNPPASRMPPAGRSGSVYPVPTQPRSFQAPPHVVGKPPINENRTVPIPSPQNGAPSSSTSSRKPLPLAPPSRTEDSSAATGTSSSDRAITTVFGSLAIVVGLFLLLVWISRRAGTKTGGALPNEAFEVLGRAPLNNRQQMQLVRLGNKLLLLSVTASAAQTLAEVTDPDEVARLSASCRQGHAGNLSTSFRQLLAGKQPAGLEQPSRPLVS